MKRCTGPRLKKVKFELAVPRRAKVFVAGSFNSWDPARHRMAYDASRKAFGTVISLPAGRHEYKFVVDGEWIVDPKCEESVPNEYGSANSALTV